MDYLENGKLKAIQMLANVPEGAELDLTRHDDHEAWLGFGWLIAKGWVAYRGGYCFAWRKGGRKRSVAYAELAQ